MTVSCLTLREAKRLNGVIPPLLDVATWGLCGLAGGGTLAIFFVFHRNETRTLREH